MTKNLIPIVAAVAIAFGAMCSVICADQPGSTGANKANAPVAIMPGAVSGDTGQTSNVGPIGAEFAMQGADGDLLEQIQPADTAEKLFLICAAVDRQAEMKLAQVAEQKSQEPQVKQIARQIVQDLQQAQGQLQTALQQNGLQLPQATPALKQQEMRVFQSLNGKEFDQQYIAHIRACHAKAMQECTDFSATAKNQQIKDYANKTLSNLVQHDQAIEQAAVALGLPNESEAQTAGARIGGENGK
jgi:putative membrane protein